MLGRSHTAVIEKNICVASDFETEPHETAWASHVRWFVNVLESEPGLNLRLTMQTSPEGLTWCDHEMPSVKISAPGLVSLPVDRPGPYVRLRLQPEGGAAATKLIIYLTMQQ